ncbi:MAG: glycosyltransferase family 1 protein [Chloroflexi bacterium]|nr:MAG: glycosyltransferase family 1 protein [Chloroflexota bacterium]
MTTRQLVGFDGLQHARPTTGSGMYALHLWQQLQQRASEGIAFALLRPNNLSGATSNVAKVRWEQAGLPWAARRVGASMVHVPYFSAPLFPLRPVVVTIHDVIPLAIPAYARTRQMRAYLQLVSRSVRRARRIITDSRSSQQDISRLLGVPGDRLRVIPLGVTPEYRPANTLEEDLAIDQTLERLQIRRPYVLNVGGFDVRKRLDLLVRGFAQAIADVETPLDLVIVGSPHSGNEQLYPSLDPLIRALGLTERVRLPGFVSEDDKRNLYRAAEVFVFTSEYEGFGLDPLEALACGAPVVCTNRTSLPEVVGDAAILVEPDAAAVGAALKDVVSNPDLRADLTLRGIARARSFTWERTAEQTLAVYRELLAVETAR